MGLQKNVASQQWRVFAFNKTNGNALTGDAANITAKIAKDWAAAVATNDVNPTETEDGYYNFTLTQAETNADALDLFPESSTANIQVIGVPGTIFTTVLQTGDNFARLGAPAGASVSADLADIPTVAEFNVRTAYAHRSIWIDTVNGAAGTVNYTNGTESNPVNSIADANTLAASLNINRFEIVAGSSITFIAAQTAQVFVGDRWTLALGGQNVANSIFVGAVVSGIMAGTGSLQKFINCVMNATSLIKGTVLVDCLLSNTQTVVEAGEFLFLNCNSSVAGTGTVTFDFGAALAASNLSVRRHSGGWTIENMGAGAGTYNASFEGHGQIIWAASCSATSNASIRGHWKITDNAGGAVTETKDDITIDVDAALADTNELQTDWANGGRLDLLLDAIPTTAMRGTDSAATATNLATVDTVVDAIKAVTDLLPNAGALNDLATLVARLTAARATNLDELGAANLPADIDSLITAIITNAAGVDVSADVAAIKAAIDTDSISELAQAAPGATPTLKAAIMLLYMMARNQLTVTATEKGVYNDAGTKIAKSTLSDDGTTFTDAEMVSGA